ncbi:MAG: 50S ribosomal protein L29 [Bacteroidota bacterium]|nr:50S ribosomal protein L29 [Bacteroidota bacterium]
MKAQELKQLTNEELAKRIEENLDALATMKFQKATSQVENSSKFSLLRKDIARMKTIIRQRELGTSTVAAQ